MARVYGGRRAPDRYRKVRRAIREARDSQPAAWEHALVAILAARRAVGAHRWPKLAAKLEVARDRAGKEVASGEELDYVLDSPDSVPDQLREFAARGYQRVNR